MTKTKTTLVNFILDKSGSMTAVREATISGFNEYIGSLKKDKGNYEFTLTLFNTQVQHKKAVPIKEVKELTTATYNPDGNTALYDAVCSTIRGVKEKKDQKVITIIMTDGEENSSKENTQVEMKKLIEEREAKGNWSFVYLGANQDSYKNAQKYGIPVGNTVNFASTTQGTVSAMSAVSRSTQMFAVNSGTATSTFFSEKDKKDLNDQASK